MAEAKLRDLGFMGRILDNTSHDFQGLSRRFSAVAEARARYIVLPTSVQDVSVAVKFATRENLSLAVKGGGNHASGASSAEDGLVIDLSNLNKITVDNAQGQVTVGGGCRWGDVYSTLHKHGLICVGGGVHIVGVGGHLTGGGWGPLTGKYGMGCDNLLSVSVVLADGQIVTANETEHPDLSWAIKGGSSQFGVVTDFVLRTFSEPSKFFYRIMAFHNESLSIILERFRTFLARGHEADEWLIGFIFFTRSPDHHKPIIVLNFTGVGDPNHYNDVWTSFREAARPSMERTVGNLSMSDLSHSFDDSLLKGPPRVMNAGCVVTDLWPGMGEELWDSFVAYTAANPDVVESMVALEFHATRRQRPELSCFPIDEPVHHAVVFHGQHHTSASDQAAAVWLKTSTSIIRRHQIRNTGKDLGLAANATSIPAAPEDIWGRSYEKLRIIKTKYDPSSVFNKFHPIPPIGSNSKAPQQPGVGENGQLRVRGSL